MANGDDLKGLSQDMANAYVDRVKRIKDVKKDTKSLLTTCKEEDKARVVEVSKLKANADKLVKDLGGDNKKLKADVGKFLDECAEEDKTRAADVSKLKADADKLVKSLGGDNKKLKADTQKLIKEFTGESKERAADVAKLLGGYAKERVATATAWKGLLANMVTTRKEKPSPIAAETKAVAMAAAKKPAKKKGKKRRKKKR